jgi:SNF2 family DNA or RNA helicase
VIHYDPWWNPAVEDQATDRAYRIGQKRTVYSVKLITRGTIEERVLALQRRKQQLYAATIGTTSTGPEMTRDLTWNDVRELLDL